MGILSLGPFPLGLQLAELSEQAETVHGGLFWETKSNLDPIKLGVCWYPEPFTLTTVYEKKRKKEKPLWKKRKKTLMSSRGGRGGLLVACVTEGALKNKSHLTTLERRQCSEEIFQMHELQLETIW